MQTLTLHITCGPLKPKTWTKPVHCTTSSWPGGTPPAIEIARSLGDVSHNVYAPAEAAGDLSIAKPGELLFIDHWADLNGMERFFSNPSAEEAADRVFASREESEWLPAPSAFTFHVSAPAARPARFVGIMRAPVRSVEESAAKLAKLVLTNLRASRRRGQLSHSLFVRLPSTVAARPASNTRRGGGESVSALTELAEVLAIDFWSTLEGLEEHYSDATAVSGLDDVLAGPPTASVWEQVSEFSEW